MKKCRKCGETKPKAQFKRDSRYADGVSSYCTVCHGNATRAWQKANPERLKSYRRQRHVRVKDSVNAKRREKYDPKQVRVINRKKRYGVSEETYAEMLVEQQWKCAICRRDSMEFQRPLAVDHDHRCCASPPTCGRCTRGLLCPPCNTAIHAIDRNPGWVVAATSYLKGKK